MREISQPLSRFRPQGRALVLAALAAAVVTTIMPARAEDDDEGNWSDKLSDTFKNSFSGAAKSMGLARQAPPPERESPSGCPTISVLPGTESQRVMAQAGAGNEGVRYQLSLGNVGRECSIAGNRVSIRVGADGRVLLGPAGAAGSFDVPIRVVVFSEATRKPIESKLFKVAASIPAGQTGAPFRFVSDSLVVPLDAGRNAADYSIKIGFDSAKGGATALKASKVRHRRTAAPAEAATR